MQIVSIGEVLWDLFGEKEFLGGAPLNFSAAAQRLQNSVALVTAVGADARGARVLEAMRSLGLSTEFVETVDEHPTGTAIVLTDDSGNGSFVIERPAAFDYLPTLGTLLARISSLKPDWIYFGTLAQAAPRTEDTLREIVRQCAGSRTFYDLNLRTGHWNLLLVQRLSAMADVLKLNESEAEILSRLTLGPGPLNIERFCRHWSSTYDIMTICVTLGDRGCMVFTGGKIHAYPGFAVKVVDTVGAGDAFAAAFLHGLHLGWPLDRIAPFANCLGAMVASRAGATPSWTIEECSQLTSLQDFPPLSEDGDKRL